jgi:hypothetical protein
MARKRRRLMRVLRKRGPDILVIFIMAAAFLTIALSYIQIRHLEDLNRRLLSDIAGRVAYATELESALVKSGLDLQFVNMSATDAQASLQECRQSRDATQDTLSNRILTLAIELDMFREQFETCNASIPFLDVAKQLAAGHAYVRDLYDCKQFSTACTEAFMEMGYAANQLTVNTPAGHHMIAFVRVPVDCTPPGVHIIMPEEFPYYFGK